MRMIFKPDFKVTWNLKLFKIVCKEDQIFGSQLHITEIVNRVKSYVYIRECRFMYRTEIFVSLPPLSDQFENKSAFYLLGYFVIYINTVVWFI